MKRFFIENEFVSGNTCVVEGEELFHMTVVLRMKEGDEVEICLNDGFVWQGKIEQIDKKRALVSLLSKVASEAEAKTEVTVFQGLCKGEKMDLIVQKLTELGVTKVIPFESRFCTVKLSGNSDRLNKIAIQSSKQCGRAIALKVEQGILFSDMMKQLKNYDLVIFANELEKFAALPAMEEWFSKRVALIVGSEGGFSKDEIELLILQSNVKSVTLGKRILRCETAAISLASIVMHSLGELGGGA